MDDGCALRHLLVAPGRARVEELSCGRRQLTRSVTRCVEGDLEAGAAIERARFAIHLDPGVRGLPQLTERDEAATILFDPGAQPRPFAQQGLVGDLDGRRPRPRMTVEREQPSVHPTVQQPVDAQVRRVAAELGASRHAPGGLAVGADHHQVLEQAAHRDAVVVVERLVQMLGPTRDRAADAAQLPVGGDGDHVVASLGQLPEHELERRQRGLLVGDSGHQLGDERALDTATHAHSGFGDRALQIRRRHRRNGDRRRA